MGKNLCFNYQLIKKMINPDYLLVFNIIVIAFIFACILFILSYILNYQENNLAKLSTYECGFQPFEDSRQFFNIEFYLVGILFVIFDLEIVFLFPLCLCINLIGFFGTFWAFSFLVVLTAGFIYEWMKGALDW